MLTERTRLRNKANDKTHTLGSQSMIPDDESMMSYSYGPCILNEAGDKNSNPIHENLDMKKASFTMPARLSRLTVTNIFKKK